MDELFFAGWIIAALNIGILIGGTVGFYASESARERRLRTTNNKLNKL